MRDLNACGSLIRQDLTGQGFIIQGQFLFQGPLDWAWCV